MFLPLSEIPLPTAAQFINTDVVQVTSTIRDNVRDIKRTLSTSIFVGPSSASSTPAIDVGDVVASVSAPVDSVCFPRRAVLRETAYHQHRYIEIWIGDVLEASRDVSAIHGAFYLDEFFYSLTFSPSQLALLYVAEAKSPTEAQDKFKFTPHLGEGLVGKKRPTILVFRWDVSTSPFRTSLSVISPIVNQPVLFGQPVFSPIDKDTIFATGYEYTRDGRLLGLRWCYNRPSGIWEIKLPAGPEDDSSEPLDCIAQKLTPPHLSCRSPVISNPSKNPTLFWLSCASGGPHGGTFSLHSCNLSSPERSSKILVDMVWEPRASDGFPGLYLKSNLPPSPFVNPRGPGQNEVFMVFSSTWGSRTTVLLVSASDGSVTDLTPDTDGMLYSWSVLATDSWKRFVCTRSSPNIPHEVVLGEFNEVGVVSWRVIHTPYISPSLKKALSTLRSSVIAIPGRGRTETVVVQPSAPKSMPPCILFPHGGPHDTTTTAFSPSTTFLALEGYTVSQPNYTGSLGFGENSVRALLGNCGAVDVQDCIAAAKHLVSLGMAVEGPGKQFVMGGSHGGFLGAHLIGQFPEMFTAAVIRNPVISTHAMSSDIPDWYFNEWNIEYPIYSSPSAVPEGQEASRALPPRMGPALFQKLFPTSPMAQVDAVRAHVLLFLGGSDLRVTPTQGLDYYHALKGNARNLRENQKIEMHWFDNEGHSLDGVEANRIVWESSVKWLDAYRT
ncbi:Alpha/Beta hydrolase protein [Mycena sp. CBHHK59/15]|nr:Alpha/Beta hydrolase protein [Mycena sp. CBHHK59/15]